MSQQSLLTTSRRIIFVQVGLGLTASLAAYAVTNSWFVGVSALSGMAVAVIATLMSAIRVTRASKMAYKHPELGVANLYTGATLRFLFAILAFGFALGGLKLAALPMILVFAVTQLGYLVPMFQKS